MLQVNCHLKWWKDEPLICLLIWWMIIICFINFLDHNRRRAHTWGWSAFPFPASLVVSLWSNGTPSFSPAPWPRVEVLEGAKSSTPPCGSSHAFRPWASCRWSCIKSSQSMWPTTTERCVPFWSRCWVSRAKRKWPVLWCTSCRAQGRPRYDFVWIMFVCM